MNICKVNTYICNEPHNIPNMKKHEKFLEFNGKNIVFVNVDGTYWIALRPILDALNMAASRSLKNLKKTLFWDLQGLYRPCRSPKTA